MMSFCFSAATAKKMEPVVATAPPPDTVRIASYSYKPADGSMVGASTVIPMRSGCGFLEVRRGEKTRWAPREARRTWETLDAWKATLPVGAVVVETTEEEAKAKTKAKAKAPAKIKITMCDSWTDDFRKAVGLAEEAGVARSAEIHVETNRTVADALLARIDGLEASRQWYQSVLRNSSHASHRLVTEKSLDNYTTEIRKLLDKVRATLAEEPFEHRTCAKYKTAAKSQVIKAQRVADGVFVPIFFDLSAGLMYSPRGSSGTEEVGVFGDSFAALGVRPVFLVPAGKGEQRLVSLEKTVGAE